MSTLQSIVKNTAARMSTEIVNRLTSAVFWVLIARYLGASGLGMLVFGMSLLALFNTLSSLGLGAVVTRDIAQQREKCSIYFGTGIILGGTCSILFVGIMSLIGSFVSPDPVTMRVVIFLSVALLPTSLFYWSKAVLSAIEKMEYIAYARIVENGFKIITGTALLLRGHGVEAIAIVIVLSRVIAAMMCFSFALRQGGKPDFHIDKQILSVLLHNVPTFASTSLLNSLFWSSTVIVLTHFHGAAEAGIFSATFKLVDVCLSISFAYGQALFPVTSRISVQAPELFVQLCRKSIKYITMFTLAVAAGTTVLSERIIVLIYGNGLAEAAQALRLQIWILVPFGMVPVLAFALVSKHYQKQDMHANAIAALSLLVLNFVLVPKYGVIGASMALLLGSTIFFISEYLFVSARLFRISIRASNLKLIILAVSMAFVPAVLQQLDVFLVILISAVFYLSMLYVTRTFSQSDLAFYRKLRSV